MKEQNKKKDAKACALEQRDVQIDKIVPNQWNPNIQSEFIYEHEKRSIQEFGFIDPVTVREMPDGQFEIIDGEHRWRGAKDLGFKTIPIINLGAIPDVKAKRLTIIMNEIKGDYDPFKMSAVLSSLSETMSKEEIGLSLPFTGLEIDNLLKLNEFDWTTPKVQKAEDKSESNDGFQHLVFIVSDAQAEVINGAIRRLVEGLGFAGKNPEGCALELIAADSLNTDIESYR